VKKYSTCQMVTVSEIEFQGHDDGRSKRCETNWKEIKRFISIRFAIFPYSTWLVFLSRAHSYCVTIPLPQLRSGLKIKCKNVEDRIFFKHWGHDRNFLVGRN
jgi:hypothetical protein